MMHVPISENRIAQFAAMFEPHNDPYVYYGDRYLGGPLSKGGLGVGRAANRPE